MELSGDVCFIRETWEGGVMTNFMFRQGGSSVTFFPDVAKLPAPHRISTEHSLRAYIPNNQVICLNGNWKYDAFKI